MKLTHRVDLCSSRFSLPIAPVFKEPLAEVLERIHAAFLTSGLGEPAIQFSLADSPLGGMSSVDRVVKRHPELQQLVWTGSPLPALPPINGSSQFAALVGELGRSLVPAIEAAAGPSSTWFNPES